MILIIAEKPSLARNIVAAIGKMNRCDGFYEGCGYIVSWAFGHLFSLADIEYYNPAPSGASGWTMENLPCFPEKFHFELRKGADKKDDAGVIKQFRILKDLCNRADVDTIVNAGDADREGEIIVRLCVNNALESEKSQKRLWLPDQTPETVRQALSEMKDESDYDNLASEGFSRTYIDWLYGVNLTRYATIKTGTLLRVGRVIIPIVKAIYDRDMAIKNFVPDKYFAVVSKAETDGVPVELVSKKKFEKNEVNKAQSLCELYNRTGATVTSLKRKKTVIPPGKLYSLSKLQNVLGKKYKMSMAESLDAVQKLYEAGYLTYPRTNSEYLATAEKGKIKKILELCSNLGYPVKFKDTKTVFDDSKIESHSAITPTYKIPDKSRLSEREMQVYSTVFRRFVAVFCAEDCVADKTEMVISVGEHEDFTLKGTVILEKGWMKYDSSEKKDKILPPLKKGDSVNIDFKPTEKETSPPRHYTIETLNNYLKNPFREEKAAAKAAESADALDAEDRDAVGVDDSEDYKALFEGLELGTEATRTGIIDNARKSGYIQLKKDVYTILPGGIFLIESLMQMGISMDKYKTAEMGKALKKVFKGEMSVENSVSLAKNEISEVFKRKELPLEEDTDTGCFLDTVGLCPICHKEVKRYKFSYGCSGYADGCKFNVNTRICQRNISVSNVKLLLETGRTSKIKNFISKNGKPFDAFLALEDGKAVFKFE